MHSRVGGDVGLRPADRGAKQRLAPNIDASDRGLEPEIGLGPLNDPLELTGDRPGRLATVRGDKAVATVTPGCG
jgi:hypothetical protein